MTDEDYQRINNFRPPHYNPPSVHWDKLSADEDIVSHWLTSLISIPLLNCR